MTVETTVRTGCRTLTVAILVALAAGCSGTADRPGVTMPTQPPSIGPSTPASSPTNDLYDDPHQQAIDAYIATQLAYLTATETADPNHPDLTAHTAGEALSLLRNLLISIRDNGLRGRGEADFQPEVDDYDDLERPTKITIRDCMDTSDTELYSVSGRPYEDTPGGFRLVIATVEVVKGMWKVTELDIGEVGTCER